MRQDPLDDSTTPMMILDDDQACEEYHGDIGDLRPQGILAGVCLFAGVLVLLIGLCLRLVVDRDIWIVQLVRLLGWGLELIGAWVGVGILRRVWRMSTDEGPWKRLT